MSTLQLQGRGTYGPQIARGPGVSPLWQYFTSPPAQNSVIIYKDGSCWEQAQFTTLDIKDPDVHLFILGGTDYRCESDSFEHQSLLAAGYSFTVIPDPNVYTETYTDDYPTR